LFKLTAKEALENFKNADKKQIENVSVRYQVLSKHTNMVGIKKNKIKATGASVQAP
jgi:hypothetical protein